MDSTQRLPLELAESLICAMFPSAPRSGNPNTDVRTTGTRDRIEITYRVTTALAAYTEAYLIEFPDESTIRVTRIIA